MTKLDIKLLVFFLLFVGIGILPNFQYDYIEDSKALRIALTWCAIPSIGMGAYYAHYSVFKRGYKQAKWRKYLAMVALTAFASLLFVRSFQGYLIFWNGHVGRQVSINLQGHVSKVEAPRRKKLLSRYSIEIIDQQQQVIDLDTKKSNHVIGEPFSKQLYKGSFRVTIRKF